MLRDIKNNLDITNLDVSAQTDATAIESAWIDVRDKRSLMFAILTGTMAATAISATVLVEHADSLAAGTVDASSAEAVPDAELLGTEAAAGFIQTDDDAVRTIGYVGAKEFVRITITPTSNDAAMPIAVFAITEALNERAA